MSSAGSTGPLHLPVAAVVFDCDGVLVDSDASVAQAWTQWAAVLGLDAAEVIAFAHGQRSGDTVERYVDPPRRSELQALVEKLEVDDAPTVTALSGAIELTTSMPRDRWCVVTSGSRVLATARLTAARIPVPPFVITADDVVNGKPHPEGYARAIARLGIEGSRVAVAEDSVAGITAALAAGAGWVIGVGSGAVPTDAQVVVRDLAGVRWTGDGLVIDSDSRLR